MKTPSEIHYQGQEIAIDDITHDLEALDFNSKEARDVVRNVLTSQSLALLQSVKEWAEVNRCNDDGIEEAAYDSALSELSSFLDEEMKKIHDAGK